MIALLILIPAEFSQAFARLGQALERGGETSPLAPKATPRSVTLKAAEPPQQDDTVLDQPA